jgi:class 3 adenylate cyclase
MSVGAPEMVAVLVTDLVGSTTLADLVGPAAAGELRPAQFGLLRGALECTGGREAENLGDRLMVVFSSASELADQERARDCRVAPHGRRQCE